MRRKFCLNERKRDLLTGYAFILPALIFMVALIGYPTVYNFIISFQDVTAATLAGRSHPFIGFGNYESILSDPLLKASFLLYRRLPCASVLRRFSARFVFQ